MNGDASADPRVDATVAVRAAAAGAARGKASPFTRRRFQIRADALRQRLRGLRRLRAACDAPGATIAITARGPDGKRLTCNFSDRLTVVELRDGVRRAIENTELWLARVEQSHARPQPKESA